MGVRSACRYASFVVCHPAPPSQRVQFVDTTMMMPTATMKTRIRHANSNTLFQSMLGIVMDRSLPSASPPPCESSSRPRGIDKSFLAGTTRPGVTYAGERELPDPDIFRASNGPKELI